MSKNLNEVLNYMKDYVENIYKHDSEPMLTFKDLKLVLDEIERLNNMINELEKWLDKKEKLTFNSWNKGIHEVQRKLQELKGSDKE